MGREESWDDKAPVDARADGMHAGSGNLRGQRGAKGDARAGVGRRCKVTAPARPATASILFAAFACAAVVAVAAVTMAVVTPAASDTAAIYTTDDVAAGIAGVNTAHADTAAYVDSVRFIQYLDENTALEEVRSGNLDMYYFRISSDRLETHQSRENLGVYESTGGSYSILANPAVSGISFNPLQNREVRFALNYLVDRSLIVNELMGGYGMPIISHYGPSDPEYLTVIEQLAAFDFGYNPALAERAISGRLSEMGADRTDGTWEMDGEPVTLTVFIRSDDPVRKAIGEILVSELERIGFAVKKEFGDLNKAFVVVYGSNPADLEWHLYTEGWARSAFVRYDSTGLAQMYSPWFSNMPGFNDPTYWNYENGKMDNLTQRIYTGSFAGKDERAELIRGAVTEGVSESVRIFLASKTDQYVTHESVSGVVNDFGAGLPSRFTPINARIPSPGGDDGGELRIGVKQIYQGSWNPVMGFRDAYSNQIGTLLSDPATFKHPYTGKTIPVRADWNVTTAGPDGVLEVADDAVVWNPESREWQRVEAGSNATSMVTFRYALGNWHHGPPMDMLDIVHSFYFAAEWGAQTGPDDATFDTEFTSIVAPRVETIKGIRPVSHDTIEVYADYWHFDEGEIAQWAAPAVTMPWEMMAAMEGVVTDGKASFSRSGAASKGTGWLSVILPNDAELIRGHLESMRDAGHVPAALARGAVTGAPAGAQDGDHTGRYEASISWIDRTGHAMVGNGPFYLDAYSPESRSIRIVAFDDDAYPFERGSWSGFERAAFPTINGVNLAGVVIRGEEMTAEVAASNADAILYFLASGSGDVIASGTIPVADGREALPAPSSPSSPSSPSPVTTITIAADDTARLDEGGNTIRIFALSEAVLRPDAYETGFLAVTSRAAVGGGSTDADGALVPASPGGGWTSKGAEGTGPPAGLASEAQQQWWRGWQQQQQQAETTDYTAWLLPALLLAAAGLAVLGAAVRSKRKSTPGRKRRSHAPAEGGASATGSSAGQ